MTLATPAQTNRDPIMARFGQALDDDDWMWCVFFVHVAKDPTNSGNGGRWRWRKWGEYIGDHQPQCEYLDDEEGFSGGVYTAAVHRVNRVGP